ncbi:MAG: hypothetical protein Q9209_005198 [Squamulea sp. 1 TL-2023]
MVTNRLYLQYVLDFVEQIMATKSPESESKRRKPSLDTTRDPRVSSRRYPLLQQAPVFETESLLNTSNVQSPSPAKNVVRTSSSSLIQPRKAFNSGRSLAPAYAATPRKNDEKKLPSSPSSSIRNNRQASLRPRPAQTSHSVPISAKNTQSPSDNARLKTPSPILGRQNSIVSPSSSASSPPRGLAESYQRIVDEESLAHEEALEEMNGYSDSPPPSEHSPHHDSMGENYAEVNKSPTSLKASRRASPHGTLDAVRPHKPSYREIFESLGGTENDTQSSAPESTRSDPSLKGDSRYVKDLRRVNGAMKSKPQIFRKALVGNRAGLTVENLKRNNNSSESLDSPFAPSLSSRGSDPSFNVPRQWGRKARPGNDWLSRINSKSGRLTGDVPKRRILDEPSLPPVGQEDSGNKLAAAAAEVPLPSGDDAASQATSSSRSSTPTAAVLRAKSRDRVLEWESRDDDFTGRSLHVSDSPPIKASKAALGKILEKEISTVAKRAVTTNRLGELRERGSAEQLGRRSSSRSRKDGRDGSNDRRHSIETLPRPAGNELIKPSKSMETLRRGEPVPDTPVVIYRSDSSSSRANEDSLDSEETHHLPSQRPKYRREDSHSLLRQLARATSASPSPSRDMSDETPYSKVDSRTAEAGRDSRSQRSDHGKKAKGKAQPSEDIEIEHTTPQQSNSTAYLKTPMVTGAWIDTPLPTGGRGPPMPTPNIEDNETKTLRNDTQKLATGDLIRKLSPHTARPKMPDEELKKTAPRLPRSALESIINAAKAKALACDRPPSPADSQEDPTFLLGESTIHSLEELITNDTDVSALLRPSPDLSGINSASNSAKETTSKQPVLQRGVDPPSASPKTSSTSYLTDLQVSTRQLSRLRNLVPSLRETKKGLASLERAVSAPSTSKALTTITSKDTGCTEAGEFHDFIWPCSRCGCPAGAGPRAPLQPFEKPYDYDFDLARISIPIPRLWRWRQIGDRRPRLTWPGVFLLSLLFLYWAEMWARETYCHKRYASTMEGFGVDFTAPRPPFVLAKVIWRKLGIGLVVEVVRFWAGLLGWIVGFGEGRQPVSRDQRIPRPEWGPDLSMMDDEYL